MDESMTQLVLDDAKDKMAKALDHLKAEFASVRTGRATPALVEGLVVDYYGAPTALKSLASFTVPDAKEARKSVLWATGWISWTV